MALNAKLLWTTWVMSGMSIPRAAASVQTIIVPSLHHQHNTNSRQGRRFTMQRRTLSIHSFILPSKKVYLLHTHTAFIGLLHHQQRQDLLSGPGYQSIRRVAESLFGFPAQAFRCKCVSLPIAKDLGFLGVSRSLPAAHGAQSISSVLWGHPLMVKQGL